MENAVIVSGARTPIGTYGGAFKNVPASELGSIVIRETVKRAGIDSDMVDEVIMGCVGQFGEDVYLARVSAIKAGLPVTTTAQTVNRICSSGLQAIVTATASIQAGMADMIVAGGAESMSRFPYLSQDLRWGGRLGHTTMHDALVGVLTDPFHQIHMGMTAERVAEKFGVSREDQDHFALESHQKAITAIDHQKFAQQIVPVSVVNKGRQTMIETDEHPKRDTSLDALGLLRPAFKKDGTITAGNASGMNDGAAAVLIMSETKAKQLGLEPILTIYGAASAGVEPQFMGTGPIPAVRKVLQRTGLTLDDIDLFESNEAFAAQALAVSRQLGLQDEKVNVNGGAIALGHPIGATGAILTVKLLYEMVSRNVKYSLATLCIGGGQGLTVIFKNSQC